MKKNSVILGLLVIAMGFGMASCTSLNQTVDGFLTTKWDKSIKTNALLYFDEGVSLYKVDGVDNLNPLTKQPQQIRGNGTAKKPKAQLNVPVGTRTIVVAKNNSDNITVKDKQKEFKFEFLPKGVYQIEVIEELYTSKGGDTAADRLAGRDAVRTYINEDAQKAVEAWEAYQKTLGDAYTGTVTAGGARAALGAASTVMGSMMNATPPLAVIVTNIKGGRKKSSAQWFFVFPHVPAP
jgi:hypothetical protein